MALTQGIETDGRSLLVAYRSKAEKSQTWLAQQVGVSQSAVSAWERGTIRPEPHHRTILASLAGVPESAWLTAEERQAIVDAHARMAGTRAA